NLSANVVSATSSGAESVSGGLTHKPSARHYLIKLGATAGGRSTGYRGIGIHQPAWQYPASDVLTTIAAKLGGRRDRDYLQALAEVLSDVLGADYVFVCTFTDPTRKRARTVASWCKGATAEDFEYDLAGT